ncbi:MULTISPECIES: porin [Grimontia]|uniref:Porin-like protein L n=1 Tax=Grimontia marina TaxID=646534 RepID=A0A128ET75_9GAMM|nr:MULTISPECIES: porin [Grimontia]WRV97707.1 porin [Grimontia sp. NTOU-MAR1]CZF77763.1 Porin-like protein L precursor [Grimontia marina]
MKKTMITASIIGAAVGFNTYAYTVYSSDESALDIGGRIEPRFNVSDANEVKAGDSSFKDISRARLHFAGETQVNDNVSVFGFYEGEMASGTSQIDDRYMFAGFDTNFGAFSYGKQDSAQVILTNVTDIMDTFGGSAADLIDANQDKRENNFVYELEIPFGVTATVNYVASDAKDNDSAGISLFYDDPIGFAFGAGYVGGKQAVLGKNVDVDQINLAASYEVGGFYIGGIYVNGEIDNVDVDGFEIAAAYGINDFVFRYVFNYRDTDNKAKTPVDYRVDYNAIEGAYNVTENFVGYAGYEFNRLDGKQNDDQMQAGIRYSF